MGFLGAKEYAVGDDGGAAAADLEALKEECEKQELGLGRRDGAAQVLGDSLLVEAALKRRVGHDERELVALLVVLRERIELGDVGRLDAVQHHVHGADAHHGGVRIMAGEHGRLEALLDVCPHELSFVVVLDVLGRHADEARAAHCWVAYGVFGRGLHELDHHIDDMSRRAELTILPAGGKLGE